MKLRVFTSKPARTVIHAGPARAYIGQYLFSPVSDDPLMIEADVDDEAAIDWFLKTGNFFTVEPKKRKPKAEATE